MKNRRGFLLAEETLKLVIAVIAIGFLVYLLVALYFSFKASLELEQAKSSLNFLMSEINSGKENVDIYNPKGWYISTWPQEVTFSSTPGPYATRTKQSPASCSDLGWDNCICICGGDKAYTCDDSGICLNNQQGFTVDNGNIQINNPPITLNIDQTNKKIRLLTEETKEVGGGFGGAGGGGF